MGRLERPLEMPVRGGLKNSGAIQVKKLGVIVDELGITTYLRLNCRWGTRQLRQLTRIPNSLRLPNTI